MKKKKQHTKQIKIKNGTTKYIKSKSGSVRPGWLINIMLAPQVQRKRVLVLGSAEPERAHLHLLITKKNRDDILQNNGINFTSRKNGSNFS